MQMAVEVPMLHEPDLRLGIGHLLVRPQRSSTEGGIEHGLRLAWANGLAHTKWLVPPNSRLVPLRMCPLCLAHTSEWRKDWRQDPTPVCQLHAVWLVTKCGVCKEPLGWPRIRLLQCQCGVALTDSPALPISSALHFCMQPSSRVSPDTLLWLGAWALYGPTNKPLKKASCTGMSDRIVMLERGADVIQGWPHVFEEALCRHRRLAPKGSVQSVAEAWPGMARQITRLPDASWRDRIWSVVNHVVAESHRSSRPIVGRNPAITRRAATQKTVADGLGIGIARLQATLAQVAPSIPARRSTAGRIRRFVSPNVEAALFHSLQAWVSVRESAALLGCGRARVSALAAAGLLRMNEGRICRESALGLRDRMLEVLQLPVSHVATKPLEHVWRTRVSRTASMGFLMAVQDRRIRIYGGSDVRDWRGVEVHAADVKAWMATDKERADQTLSMTEAAAFLKIKEQVAYELADRGLLSTTSSPLARRGSRRVNQKALSDFAEQYVALSVLAHPHDIHSHAALAWAQGRKLEVVTGPRIDGGRQYFVKRTTV